ncbi:LacI family DNA-binding transcriptional regulator [Hufsiella ginkgonis]|uniref:Substrate-binding domain-containing protein n=1 Tax=Hufsiella ginkgonis TaxID=2695274 RepID=A0A7K1Y133_9SPHI|nr:LacI family DNA-binding transcriptional regulator [Hufsiella ginkgonis]MXV16386.1 substrate-binding domain-containing protein [Hufsiella ginkgonis]
MGKITARDVARAFGISKTTISFIVNGKSAEKGISPVLTEKVLGYMKEHGYRPNHFAKSLSTGKSMTIGLMVEKISDYFFSQLVYHLEELANRHGYQIIFCSTENNGARTRELIRLFRNQGVDGFIITPPEGIQAEIRSLQDDQLPFVLFDRYLPGIDADHVVLDNLESTRHAVQYLVERGARHIGYVELDSEQSQMRDRKAGYLQALGAIAGNPRIMRVPFNNGHDDTVTKIAAFIKHNPELDALFFATNYLAMSGMKAMFGLGIRIPQDMAVVSFDDHIVFDTYLPTITAVAQPIAVMAENLFGILISKIKQGPGQPPTRCVIPARLVIRDSTGPPV